MPCSNVSKDVIKSPQFVEDLSTKLLKKIVHQTTGIENSSNQKPKKNSGRELDY